MSKSPASRTSAMNKGHPRHRIPWASALAAILALGCPADGLQAAVSANYRLTFNPYRIQSGYLDKNTQLDVAVIDASHEQINLYLDVEASTILPTPTPLFSSPGRNLTAIELADTNGDYNNDIIVLNASDNTVNIMLGKGDGTFFEPKSYPVGRNPSALQVVDVNRDGLADILIVNTGSQTVSVLMANKDGTYRPRLDYFVGYTPYSVTTADINRDGILDIIASTDMTLSLLYGLGDGRFRTRIEYKVGKYPYSFQVADLNQDGYLDMVTANAGSDTISVLLGQKSGVFQYHIDFKTAASPYSLQLDDFDNDGTLDVATMNYSEAGSSVSVLLNFGNGRFHGHADYPLDMAPFAMMTGKNHRSSSDASDLYVVADPEGGVLMSKTIFFAGNGDGTFQNGRASDSYIYDSYLNYFDSSSCANLGYSCTNLLVLKRANGAFDDLNTVCSNSGRPDLNCGSLYFYNVKAKQYMNRDYMLCEPYDYNCSNQFVGSSDSLEFYKICNNTIYDCNAFYYTQQDGSHIRADYIRSELWIATLINRKEEPDYDCLLLYNKKKANTTRWRFW